MKKILLASLFLFYNVCFIVAQNNGTISLSNVKRTSANPSTINRCGSHEKYMERLQQDPSLAQKREQMEAETKEWIQQHSQQQKTNTVVTIPVVVHVVYRTSAQNISDAQIQSQIDALNADYRKLNADTSNIPSAFQAYAADVEFEFCLANIDPNGNSTTGITRIQTSIQDIGSTSSYYYSSQGGDDIWDRDSYMNIWVCEISGGTLGFAYLAGTAPADYDGIVIQPQYFGTTGTVSAPYHLGRTATHEVGHWFNLNHIWGDDNGACTGTDNVNDTPDQADYTGGCPTFPQTDACTGSSPGIMFMNYMDYSDDDCMNMFSQGQASRMLSAINLYRSGLITSSGCSGNTLNANFSASATSVSTGSSIDYTDKSTGSPISWSWTFQGGNPSASTSQNPTGIVYDTTGTYDVTLVISDGINYDTLTKTDYITVYNSSSGCDTITNVPNGSIPYIYSVSGLGYISGHNLYEDMAKADYFTTSPTAKDLSSAIVYFTEAQYASSSSIVSLTAWDNTGSNGKPGTELGSKDVLITDIYNDVQNSYFTTIDFTTPITITGNYYVGIEFYYGSTDTVVIGTTKIGDVTANTAWEQYSDATWHEYGYTYDFANFIYPIFCGTTVGINPDGDKSSLLLVSPNPFQEEFEITLLNKGENISFSKDVQLSIYNMLGKKIWSKSENEFEYNKAYKITSSHFNAGIYYLQLVNGNQKMVAKIIKGE